MNVLVTGGTGTVGSQVVRELMNRGAQVTVLTRDRAKAAKLPPGVHAVQGNLQNVETVRTVFNGTDAVFLISAVSQTESHEALLAVCGMRLAGIRRVVYLSVHHADDAAWLPHFGSKVGAEEALRYSGIPFTILRPNNFFQNEYWFKDSILQAGLYPQPLGSAGVSRVDVRDIAEAAAITLLSPDHAGETYDLVGPELQTGESTAAVWSRVLGRKITYAGDDLDAWERQQLQYMPDWLVFDFRLMYDYFQKNGLKASAEAIERQTRLLGHAPRRFEKFAEETAAMWVGPASAA